MVVKERDGISFRIISSFYKLLFLSPNKPYTNTSAILIFTIVPNNLLTSSLIMRLPIVLDVTLISSNIYRSVELSQSRSIPRTKQTVDSRRKHIFSISRACRECDVKCDRSQDVGLGRSEECGWHNIAERARRASSWCNAEGNGNIVDRLDVIGGCEGYGEGIVGVYWRGCGDACDDGGGRGKEGREEQSWWGGWETHFDYCQGRKWILSRWMMLLGCCWTEWFSSILYWLPPLYFFQLPSRGVGIVNIELTHEICAP